jgi:hypothetical protein
MAERELLARSPRSRKSLGAIGSEKENVGGKVMAGGIKGGGLGRKRAVSISGPSSVKMKDVELSPRRKARRSMVSLLFTSSISFVQHSVCLPRYPVNPSSNRPIFQEKTPLRVTILRPLGAIKHS